MNIAFFFTYGYSLKTWKESGVLDRELKILEFLTSRYGYKFTLFTYGDSSEFKLLNNRKNFKIVPVYNVIKKSNIKLINYIKSLFLPLFLKKYLSEINIIHQHQLQGVWVSLLIKILYRKPLVVRTGYDVYTFSKLEKKSKLKILTYKILTYFSLVLCNLYTVTSKNDFEILKNTFELKNNKIKIRPNFIENIKINSDLAKRYKNRILSVGRLVNQKNFTKLINEFSNTFGEYEIDIVGSGELKSALIKEAKAKNVKLNLLGNLTYKDLMELYQKYLFYIAPSVFEGNPKTVLEAMASGCIVIASKIENHSELILENKEGLLFDLNQPSLLQNISNLRNNMSLCKDISENAINRVQLNNSIDVVAEKIDKDYRNILQLS